MTKQNEQEAPAISFDARNYRKHGKKNKDLIKKSLEELGAGRSVLIDKENSLIAGNGVYEQAQALSVQGGRRILRCGEMHRAVCDI